MQAKLDCYNIQSDVSHHTYELIHNSIGSK